MRVSFLLFCLGLTSCLEAPQARPGPEDMGQDIADVDTTKDIQEDIDTSDCPTRDLLENAHCKPSKKCGVLLIPANVYPKACNLDDQVMDCGQCGDYPGMTCKLEESTCICPEIDLEAACANIACGETEVDVCNGSEKITCPLTCERGQRCLGNQCLSPYLPGRLLPQEDRDSMRYGEALASHDKWLMIGAPGDRGGQGSVFVYERFGEEWQHVTTLTPPTSTRGFGANVSLQGSLLAVGAPSENINAMSAAGAVYIFTLEDGAWNTAPTRIEAPAPAANMRLGEVLLWGWETTGTQDQKDTLYVGAPLTNITQNMGTKVNAGEVHLWKKNLGVWEHQMTISTPDFSPDGTHFGASLAEGADGLFVGAPNVSNPSNMGTVYLYQDTPNGLTLAPNTLLAKRLDTMAQFGASLSLDGDTLLVGAPLEEEEGARTGAVYLFKRQTNGTWGGTNQDQIRLVPDSPLPDGAGFGQRVLCQGSSLLVTATHGDDGKVFYFSKDNQDDQRAWLTPNAHAYPNSSAHHFGTSLTIYGSTLLLGAPGLGEDDSQQGFVFPLTIGPQ